LIFVPIFAAIYYQTTIAIFEDIKKTMGKHLKKETLPIFEYLSPILNARRIRLGKASLTIKTGRRYLIKISEIHQTTKKELIERAPSILLPIYEHLMNIRQNSIQ
jgi:hypothetical protein